MVWMGFFPEDLTLDTGLVVSILGVVVTALGGMFVTFAYLEYGQIRKIRDEFQSFRKEIAQEQHQALKATQRIMASYNVKDVDQRISLLKMAVETCPAAFNGYNALGYAYVEKGEVQKAIDAFSKSISQHPEAKEGYFDLAVAHLTNGEKDLCMDYLAKAISVDPTARDDLEGNPLFAQLAEDERFKRLLWRY